MQGESNGSNLNVSSIEEKVVNLDEVKPPRTKRRGKGIAVVLLVILVILFLGVGLGVGYLKFFQPKNVFKVLIHNSFDYLEGSMISSDVVLGDFSLSVDMNMDNQEAQKSLDLFNKIRLSGTYGVDYSNRVMDIELDSLYDQKDLVQVGLYMDDGNGYFYLDQLYDRYIKFPIDKYDSLFKNMDKQSDQKIVFHHLEDALVNSLRDEYFEKKKVTLDGDTVDQTTLKIDQERYEEIREDVVQSLIDDQEFLKSYSVISGFRESEVQESLKDILEEDDEFSDIEISIYSKNTKFLQLEVVYSNYKILIQKKSDEEYQFEYDVDDAVSLRGSVIVKKSGEQNHVTFSLENKDRTTSLKLDLTNSVKYDGKLKKKDVSNSVDVESISDEEIRSIYSKLLEKDGVVQLIQDLSSLGENGTNLLENDSLLSGI